MPFTPAHAAAALPFRKTRLSMPALVIGTFAPDFHYFLQLAPRGGYGHTLVGAFTASLPMALAVLWLYETFVREPLFSLLPKGLHDRLPRKNRTSSFRNIGGFAWAALSAMLGIITHILWDSFTHHTMWPYRHWAFLHRMIFLPGIGARPCYKLLQYGSSVLGVAILLLWFFLWYHRSAPAPEPEEEARPERGRICAAIVLIAVAGSVFRVWVSAVTDATIPPPILLADGVVTLIALLWWELVAYGIVTRIRRRAA